ncbi:MAG: hypothetical protein LBN42_00525 [Oscillospiraceae bacterium]|jgi:tetratricopeptide (TPR) repeat protein|nr:hypothetical protein [Oscillospiraceae bacterium]
MKARVSQNENALSLAEAKKAEVKEEEQAVSKAVKYAVTEKRSATTKERIVELKAKLETGEDKEDTIIELFGLDNKFGRNVLAKRNEEYILALPDNEKARKIRLFAASSVVNGDIAVRFLDNYATTTGDTTSREYYSAAVAVYTTTKEYDKAVEYTKKTIALATDKSEKNFETLKLPVILAKAGRNAEAKKYWEDIMTGFLRSNDNTEMMWGDIVRGLRSLLDTLPAAESHDFGEKIHKDMKIFCTDEQLIVFEWGIFRKITSVAIKDDKKADKTETETETKTEIETETEKEQTKDN